MLTTFCKTKTIKNDCYLARGFWSLTNGLVIHTVKLLLSHLCNPSIAKHLTDVENIANIVQNTFIIRTGLNRRVSFTINCSSLLILIITWLKIHCNFQLRKSILTLLPSFYECTYICMMINIIIIIIIIIISNNSTAE